MATLNGELRRNLYELLTEKILTSMEGGSLTSQEAHDIASYILDKLNVVENEDELYLFLDEIAQKWAIFSDVKIKLLNEKTSSEDIEKINNIKDKLDQLVNTT